MESCQYPEEWLHIKEEYRLLIEEKWQIKKGYLEQQKESSCVKPCISLTQKDMIHKKKCIYTGAKTPHPPSQFGINKSEEK